MCHRRVVESNQNPDFPNQYLPQREQRQHRGDERANSSPAATMPPPLTHPLFSPPELSYTHTSLLLQPPIRPDARTPTQFRPIIAETNILPGTNGSARICFPDGNEAVVGVKAEVERSAGVIGSLLRKGGRGEGGGGDDNEEEGRKGVGENAWVELTIEIPGLRDDDALPVFLAAMLNEALLASGDLVDRLWINQRWHWKLYIDILLLSPPLSYPIPLLSLTTHLALLSARLPRLISEADEDPLFDNDWEASIHLYPRHNKSSEPTPSKPTATKPKPREQPPVTLLVTVVGENIFFDPSLEEIAVADLLLAVSISETIDDSEPPPEPKPTTTKPPRNIRLLSLRTIDPPARLTPPGVPDALNTAVTQAETPKNKAATTDADVDYSGVWVPPKGGSKRKLIGRIIQMVIEHGGVGEEVLEGLEGVDVG
ncbi:hypothetical protein FGG08_001797 [Glutinoglossum americanum]|uniref:Ribosomal RNA-processing protein 42 n=1 Tax=Glutinoglossum americanum TaxID=1670608 RepID=A0A9P8KZT9_9PEZI|nr:hypothetical protein FGG08_001797 [Glutinoglossum americanum]